MGTKPKAKPRSRSKFGPRWLTTLVIGAILLVTLSPLWVDLGLQTLAAFVPPDSGETVDAIVVLGRGEKLRDLRAVQALDLWKSKRAPQIFISGMLDARPMVEILKELKVPGQYVSGEECSQSTHENALFTAALLSSQATKKILLVTDSPHMLRSLLAFRSFGFQVVPHSIPLPKKTTFQHKLLLMAREYLGLAKYTFQGQFTAHSTTGIYQPEKAVTQKIRDWSCHVKG